MRCPRCSSSNIVKIGHLIYCRNCISFGQIRLHQPRPRYDALDNLSPIYFDLDYDLSVTQKILATSVLKALERKHHVLIQAVCGSGKTELVYPSICHYLNNNCRVGFASPRKDLTIEIHARLESQIKGVEKTLVYGGHTNNLYAPLVCLTCHQLHRYWRYFDLLIIDEVDAFPFYGNELLYSMAKSACKGQLILLSATSFEYEAPPHFEKFTLERRYHFHDLPVPKLFWMPETLSLVWMLFCIKQWQKNAALIIIYVPLFEDLNKVYRWFSFFRLKCEIISSKTQDNARILDDFRHHKFSVLISTTLLERGVTFENVQVMVYKANHPLFNTSTLIQIAGRVGRKPSFPDGKVYFFANQISKEMKQCKKRLLQKNASSAINPLLDSFKTKKI